MKKLIFALSATLFTLSFCSNLAAPFLSSAAASQSASQIAKASGSKPTYYAKITSPEAYLYSQAIDNDDYFTFKLPNTYFVLLTGQADENFYICRYLDVMGYVKIKDVTPMDGTPDNPYLDYASFTIFSQNGLDLCSSPTKTASVLTHVNFLESRLTYYGTIIGDDIVPDMTNVWYYCKLTTDTQKQFGYIYSGYCYKLTQITDNFEEFAPITTPLFPNYNDTAAKSAPKLSATAKTLIIIGVCLPCLVIIYLLIKPTLLSDTNKKSEKQKRVKHKRKGDYFEFDESDLN